MTAYTSGQAAVSSNRFFAVDGTQSSRNTPIWVSSFRKLRVSLPLNDLSTRAFPIIRLNAIEDNLVSDATQRADSVMSLVWVATTRLQFNGRSGRSGSKSTMVNLLSGA